MERKRANIILLPTTEESLILRNTYKYTPAHGNPLVFNEGQIKNYEERGYESIKMYVTSKTDIIRGGDEFLDSLTNKIHVAGDRPVTMKCFHKVIASSEFTLLMLAKPKKKFSSQMERQPLVSINFIKEFCEMGGVDEVDVMYETNNINHDLDLPIKYQTAVATNSKNEITIKLIRESWNREEMENLTYSAMKAKGYTSVQEHRDWCKENL